MLPALKAYDQPHVTPEDVASVLGFIPSAPTVLPRLYAMLRENNTSLQQIAEVLRLDAGLVARVLQLGNHLAAGRRGGHCFTIEEAINQIGFDELSTLIAHVAKAQVFSHSASLYGLDAEEIWRRSVACALAAEMLAHETGEDTSVAYTIGLLHNVGILAIDEWALQTGPTLMFTSNDDLSDFIGAERAMLGFTQADVGAALLRRWSLPLVMVEPVRWQYAPLGSAGYARLACLLCAAKWLRSAVCAEEGDRPPPLPSPVVLRPLRLTPERLARYVVELRIRMGEVRNLVETTLV